MGGVGGFSVADSSGNGGNGLECRGSRQFVVALGDGECGGVECGLAIDCSGDGADCRRCRSADRVSGSVDRGRTFFNSCNHRQTVTWLLLRLSQRRSDRV